MQLFSVFSASAEQFPQKDALWVDGNIYSYRHLFDLSAGIEAALNATNTGNNIALLASRSITAYSSILGILKSGRAYVPLNPKFPSDRNAWIIENSGSGMLIIGQECMPELLELVQHLPVEIILYFPFCTTESVPLHLRERFTCFFSDSVFDFPVKNTNNNSLAYILFTSGSTGIPKGVPVKQSSVVDYINYLAERYKPDSSDRFSQTFDLTFDLSVHDLFLCWKTGACLYAIPEKTVLGPSKFIREHSLTFWFSVPSVVQFMDRFRMLKPGIFPSLRTSLFCGEPLPLSIAKKWQEAVSNQRVENIYGPTEATIGITHYQLPSDPSLIKSRNGIVSIGSVFSTQKMKTDSKHAGEPGELLLGGSQLAEGYWNNAEKTKEAFFSDADGNNWYRTGDLVEIDSDGDIFFISRKDFQVKIRGYRIELGEVNHAISNFTGQHLVFSMPYPVKDGIAESIYSFISSHCEKDKNEILRHLEKVLPDYMVPKDIIFVDEFPLNSNGKIDTLALIRSLAT